MCSCFGAEAKTYEPAADSAKPDIAEAADSTKPDTPNDAGAKAADSTKADEPAAEATKDDEVASFPDDNEDSDGEIDLSDPMVEEAAIAIQKAFRGYQGRASVIQMHLANEVAADAKEARAKASTDADTASFPNDKEDGDDDESDDEIDLSDPMVEEAAIAIQKAFRGYQGRASVIEMHLANEIAADAAATKAGAEAADSAKPDITDAADSTKPDTANEAGADAADSTKADEPAEESKASRAPRSVRNVRTSVMQAPLAEPCSVLLHDPRTWPQQSAALEELRRSMVTMPALAETLKRTSHKFEGEGEFERGAFAGGGALATLFDSEEEWWALISYVAGLALRSVALFETTPLAFLAQGFSGHVRLSRTQVASLNALAFFNALPSASPHPEMPEHLSFRHWLSGAAAGEADGHKARCLVHYFRRIREHESNSGDEGDGITLTRLVLPAECAVAALDTVSWTQCTTPLQPLIVERSRSVGIEDAKGALQASFANEYIGGGVMCGGCLQEEIRFATCPECLVANLLCPRMMEHEAIVISGIKKYAGFTGYGDSFECAGVYPASKPTVGVYPDPRGSTATILAIDACAYLGEDRRHQYETKQMLRDLTKLWVGLSTEGCPGGSGSGDSDAFTSGGPFATGNWGCGAFGGDLQLKALLQWMAASRAGRTMIYYPYGDSRADDLDQVSANLLATKMTVGNLAELLFESSTDALQGCAFAVVLAEVNKSGQSE